MESTVNQNETSEDLDGGHCEGWMTAQHAVFQLSNLCILISFLTPIRFKYHFFFLRIMLNFGFLIFIIWSAAFVCMPDVVIWNSVFIVINSGYIIYIGYMEVPVRFSKTLEDVYLHSFKPLKVTRKQFKELADFGTMQLLGKGVVYARQDQSKTGQKLSLLLKGRLKVSFDESYLHSIEANHFVDSPEFDAYIGSSTQDTFKVTISAVEDSLLYSWSHDRLVNHLSRDPVFKNIFNQLIGKDISQKLYEIQELVMACSGYVGNSTRRSSMVNVRHSIVSSSTTNLNKLNCLQGCIVNNEHTSNLSSNGTYETSV
ncbi:hypothetical protein ACF0H5_008011 [Mactra antiquata]